MHGAAIWHVLIQQSFCVVQASQQAIAAPQQQEEVGPQECTVAGTVEEASPSVAWPARSQRRLSPSPSSLDEVAEEHPQLQLPGGCREKPKCSSPELPPSGDGRLAAQEDPGDSEAGRCEQQTEGDTSAEGGSDSAQGDDAQEGSNDGGSVGKSRPPSAKRVGFRAPQVVGAAAGSASSQGSEAAARATGLSQSPTFVSPFANCTLEPYPGASLAALRMHAEPLWRCCICDLLWLHRDPKPCVSPGGAMLLTARPPSKTGQVIYMVGSLRPSLGGAAATSATEAAGEGQSAGGWLQGAQRQKSAPAGYRGLALGRQNTGTSGAGVPAPCGRTVSPSSAVCVHYMQSCALTVAHATSQEVLAYKAPCYQDNSMGASNEQAGL